MTTDAETLVRRAYHLAEGNVMDVQGFVGLFAEDGEINAGTMNFRGEQLGWIVEFLAKFAPDIHRELNRVVVQDGTPLCSSWRSKVPSRGHTSRLPASFSRTEPNSTFPALISGSWKTARSSNSTATSA